MEPYFAQPAQTPFNQPAMENNKKNKTVYDLDEHAVNVRSARIALLANLAWDYAETVRDISIEARMDNRRECRNIKQLRELYDRDMQYAFNGCLDELDRLALQFESLCSAQMSRYLNVLKNECRICDMFAVSLFQAVLILDVMRLFCKGFDKWLAEQGVIGRSTYSSFYAALEDNVRSMLNRAIHINSDIEQIQRTAALIFYNELMSIDMVEDKELSD